MKEEGDLSFASPCDCTLLDRRVALYNAAAIPARFSGKWIEDIEELDRSQKELKYALLKHRDTFTPGDRGFLIWGASGVGKTHAVCGLLAYLTLEHAVSCRYVDFMQLLYDLKQAYAQNRWESDLVSPLLAVDVLVIDELGKGRNTEWELSILDELISARYNAHKTLHCTSNYPPEQTAPPGESPSVDGGLRLPGSLQERLGERIYSRLHEMCRFVQVSGEDYRRRAGKRPVRRSGGTA